MICRAAPKRLFSDKAVKLCSNYFANDIDGVNFTGYRVGDVNLNADPNK